jgi:Protein of unknown function (DUF1036)
VGTGPAIWCLLGHRGPGERVARTQGSPSPYDGSRARAGMDRRRAAEKGVHGQSVAPRVSTALAKRPAPSTAPASRLRPMTRIPDCPPIRLAGPQGSRGVPVSLSFSNSTPGPVWVVIAYNDSSCGSGGNAWMKEGWWQVQPGGNVTVHGGPSNGAKYFYFAHDNSGREWAGEFGTQVPPTPSSGAGTPAAPPAGWCPCARSRSPPPRSTTPSISSYDRYKSPVNLAGLAYPRLL